MRIGSIARRRESFSTQPKRRSGADLGTRPRLLNLRGVCRCMRRGVLLISCVSSPELFGPFRFPIVSTNGLRLRWSFGQVRVKVPDHSSFWPLFQIRTYLLDPFDGALRFSAPSHASSSTQRLQGNPSEQCHPCASLLPDPYNHNPAALSPNIISCGMLGTNALRLFVKSYPFLVSRFQIMRS